MQPQDPLQITPEAQPQPVQPQPMPPQPTVITPDSTTPQIPPMQQPSPMQQPAQPMQPMMMQPAQSNKKSIVKIVLIVAGVVAVIAIGLIILIFTVVKGATKDAEVVSGNTINAIQANNPSQVSELSNESFKNSTTPEELATLITGISPLVQGEEQVVGRRIVKNAGQPTRSAIVYKVPTDGGDVYIRVVLEQETSGEWKVLNFRSSETLLEAEIE